MENIPVWFEQARQRANDVAASYDKRCNEFETLVQAQSRIFAGTGIARYLSVLKEHVRSAYSNNQEAGWLPPSGSSFTDLELFETFIRHDRTARRFKSLSEVPAFLLDDFEDWGDDEFRAHAQTLREACRDGYDGLAESRVIMEDEPDCEEFFDGLYNWPEHAGATQSEISQAEALVNNLYAGWKQCQKAGLDLLHAACYEHPDYDPSLMEALMED